MPTESSDADHALPHARAGMDTSEPVALAERIATLTREADAKPKNMSLRLDLARAYLDSGQTSDAIALLQQVAQQRPKQRWAWIWLIEAWAARQDHDMALKIASDALAHLPDDFKVSYKAFEVLDGLGCHEEALRRLAPFVARTDLTSYETLNLTRALRRCGELSAAQTVLSALLERDPEQVSAWVLALELAWEQADPIRSVVWADRAYAQVPEDMRVWRHAMKIYRQADRTDKIAALLGELHERVPDDLKIALDYANALEKAGQAKAAEEVYALILRLDPGHPKARAVRMKVAERNGDLETILQCLEEDQPLADAEGQKAGGLSLPKDPRALARYAQLAFRLDDAARMAAVVPVLGPVLQDLPDRSLLSLLRLSLKFPDQSLAGQALKAVMVRQDIDRELALEVLQWGCVLGNDAQAVQMQCRLAKRVLEAQQAEFEMDALLLRAGPEEAYRKTRALLPFARTADEALRLADAACLSGRGRLAIRYLRRAVRRWPHSFDLHKALVLERVEHGHIKAAYDDLEHMSGRFPARAVTDLRIRALMSEGNLQAALDLARSVQTHSDSSANYGRNLRMEVFLGDLEQATKSVQLSRMNNRAHFRTSHIGAMFNELQIYKSGRSEEAEITEQDVMAFFQPARQIIDRMHKAPPGPAPDGLPITRKIFQYWDTPERPAALDAVMDSWRDIPGWSYQCFDRRSAIAWLRETFGPNRVRAFRLTSNAAEEADFFRLCVLEAEGGLYVDSDDKRIDQPEKLLEGVSGALIFREPFGAIANNVIYAPPRHPLMRFAARLAQRSLLARENDSTWSKTGPGLLSRATALFLMKQEPGTSHQLTILPQHQMQRAIKPHMRMPHKLTSRHWNAKITSLPDAVKRILEQEFL